MNITIVHMPASTMNITIAVENLSDPAMAAMVEGGRTCLSRR
jgi:hypothetical protein